MAKVASRGPMVPSSGPLRFSGSDASGGSSNAAVGIKRKTPSELRGEQLKRKNVMGLVDDSLLPETDSTWGANGVTCEHTKPNLPKNPRYLDTRVDELFPSTKSVMRLRLLSGKGNAKDKNAADHTDSLKNSSVPVKFVAERQAWYPGPNDSHTKTTKDGRATISHNTNRKCSESTFRSVTELSSQGEKLSGFSLDMDKALKGLASLVPPIVSTSPAESLDGNAYPTAETFCSGFRIPGRNAPLDFTLKTSMRVVSSSSVNWFHRMVSCGPSGGSEPFNSQAWWTGDQKMTCSSVNFASKSFHSWVYPQCSLPTSVISALTLSAKGEGQSDFLNKRQLAWETSLRSLYVMLRKNICNIFYVCTGQFVAMFTGGNGTEESRHECNAYLSQSTRTLRSLLKEQDICFTMPLCQSKVEEVTTEDLFELSEIEKYNVGTTKRAVSLSDVDNTPESLLAFEGNNNVHGLYDFLLNYRFLLTSMTNVDVPLLYSHVPFENAAFSAPEVKCKEVRRIDNMPLPPKEPCATNEHNQDSVSTSYYSIEIKDAYLPPWITNSVCNAMVSNGGSFEVSFVTDPVSVGLNVGLEMACEKSEPEATSDDSLQENSLFGIANTVLCPRLRRGFLKGLKYSDGSYTASLSPV